ncbi:hypothetical protein [uncultured Mediterranean phage uvMED]|nr:hypothetical protein [uncultured Mediterranean phage uvMED]
MLRGAGNEFNGFGRMFKSVDEANAAVANGDYNPTEGQVNAVLVLSAGIMIYSFDLQDFVHISEFSAAGNQANKYIELDGANDYIEFSNAGDVLDFTKNWSIGITLVGVTGAASASNMTLFGRGGVQITLKAQAGSTNWGLYVTSDNDLYNANGRAQANTWYAPSDFDRILFTYDAATKRLKYFLGSPASGTYAQRANLAIPQTMVDTQNIAGGLCIGKSWTGVGGAGFSGINWHGGLNNMIVSNMAFVGPQLDEYFQTGEEFTSMELYGDVVSYAKLGEDTFPTVTDEKGLLTGGALINGSNDDFKDIPTE